MLRIASWCRVKASWCWISAYSCWVSASSCWVNASSCWSNIKLVVRCHATQHHYMLWNMNPSHQTHTCFTNHVSMYQIVLLYICVAPTQFSSHHIHSNVLYDTRLVVEVVVPWIPQSLNHWISEPWRSGI